MNTGLILAIAGLVVAVLGWLEFKPNGPRLLARLIARIQVPRKEREELRKQVEALSRGLDDQMTLIKQQGKLFDQNLSLHKQLSEWVRDLQTDVHLLRTDPAPLKLEKRVEVLEDAVSRVFLAGTVGLPPAAWDEVERVFGPKDEPAKETPLLQAPDYRHTSN
jgi:hypothetical protein